MISEHIETGGNELLATLPPLQLEMLLQGAERVTLAQDESLGAPGQRIRYAHFMLDGFIALLAEVNEHEALAVDLVGSEGMVGVPLVLGVHTSVLRARVHGAGSALRIGAVDFQRALAGSPAFERQLRRYMGLRLARIARSALCASFHGVEARLAGWLLMAHDRAHGDRFYLTHDRLAGALGVRRSGVTTAAGVLQGRQWIGYTRGHIVVMDRAGLEGAACSCYGAVHQRSKPAVAGRLGAVPHRPERVPALASAEPSPSLIGGPELPATPMPGGARPQDQGARSRS